MTPSLSLSSILPKATSANPQKTVIPEFRINDLPYEVVGRILENCVAARDGVDPLTLMLVCKSWSQLALDTPSLWAHINLPSYMQHLESKVSAYLCRSKVVPLQVVVGRRSSIGCLRVINTFYGHLERIRSFKCAASVGTVDVLWDDICKMTILEELVLEKSPEISPTVTSRRKTPIFIPSIRKLSLENVDVPWSKMDLPSIEELELLYTQFQSVVDMNQVFDTLAKFNTLRKLSIKVHHMFPLFVRFWEEGHSREGGPTPLPMLEELALKGLTNRQVGLILEDVSALALRKIVLLEGLNEGFVAERWQALAGGFPLVTTPQLVK